MAGSETQATSQTGGGSSPVAPSESEKLPLVLLVGNPNTGKTTLFNRLTGQNARIGNYPGVTVERRSGNSRLDGTSQVEVVDLPGTYSLSARSPEEQIALWAIVGHGPYRRPARIDHRFGIFGKGHKDLFAAENVFIAIGFGCSF